MSLEISKKDRKKIMKNSLSKDAFTILTVCKKSKKKNPNNQNKCVNRILFKNKITSCCFRYINLKLNYYLL